MMNKNKNICARMFAAVLLASTVITGTASAETTVRLQSLRNEAAFSEGYAMSVEDWTTHTLQARSNNSTHFWHQSQNRPQVWIADIGTLLFDDSDKDGYHAGFSLTIDIDSEFGDTEVYARIYLESALSPLTLLHKTNRFSVYGTTIGDEYRVDTELRNNIATDDYNIVIDIHNAWTDELIDTANERGFENLRLLPLESAEQQYATGDDDVYGDSSGDHHHDETLAGVRVTEHAASFHPILVALLAGGIWLRRRQRLEC